MNNEESLNLKITAIMSYNNSILTVIMAYFVQWHHN